MDIGNKMMQEAKFYMGYSRWMDVAEKYETWEESVNRVMSMHYERFADRMTPKLAEYMEFAAAAYREQLILGQQRALQYGGDQLMKHQARLYNCSFGYGDRPAFFNETMYLLLCGCGVGFSVQSHHVAKLPNIQKRSEKKIKIFNIPDSIEGWSDSIAVLLSSYFEDQQIFPEYKGCQVHFNFDQIRPKGSHISGGFKAPGAEPLRKALIKIEELINDCLVKGQIRLKPINVYDVIMHIADAVISGGVRRSATICLFDKDDGDMLKAKTGNWFAKNPQRGRSNNSAIIVRDELSREEWKKIISSVKQFGEPGFVFVDDKEMGTNPCVEIGMRSIAENGKTGWQFCNLIEQNGAKCTSREILLRSAKASAILATLQADYTDFKYVSEETKMITEREALIGVSITGWMNNPEVLFDVQNMRDAAELVKAINKEVAEMIGINQAARTTCTKPAGNSSTILVTGAGIHGVHAPRYFRNVQMNDQDDVAKLIETVNPEMVQKSVWSANGTDVVVSFPVVSNEDSIFRQSLYGTKLLEYVKLAQQNWVEYGTNEHLCVDKRLRHNISNTISVDDWDEVEQYLFDNRQYFAGVSLLGINGDKDYAQAPFTEVLEPKKLFEEYGTGSMFASGLIVDAMHAFDNDLWVACSTFLGHGEILSGDNSEDLLKRDWVRRAKKFSTNFFGSDDTKTTYCLKDCYNLHRWEQIQRTIKEIDFDKQLTKKTFTEIDTLGASACAGGGCSLDF